MFFPPDSCIIIIITCCLMAYVQRNYIPTTTTYISQITDLLSAIWMGNCQGLETTENLAMENVDEDDLIMERDVENA